MSEILVTGGAGYIGSHMCVELLQAGHEVVVADNLCNSSPKSLAAVQRITQKSLTFRELDLRDGDALRQLFAEHAFSAVMHFGGLKAVGESVSNPTRYYDNNVNATLRLIDCMQAAEVKTLVFSSSATVYGVPENMPITEDFPTAPINPYGRSKLMVEDVLRDLFVADPEWRISMLRYFNPVGSHPSGEIGEDPNGIPNNLVPFISQVAVGKRPHLNVFADDYPTPDGTGIRDYIHVLDLVRGHLHALEYLARGPGCSVHNLGTGQGHSVFEVLHAFEAACGRTLPYKIVERRPGDAAESYAATDKAAAELNWRAEHDLQRMCEDVWRWQSRYPDGFVDG